MKKKLKDLSMEEISSICSKYTARCNNGYEGCPFESGRPCMARILFFLNREIDIDEERKKP